MIVSTKSNVDVTRLTESRVVTGSHSCCSTTEAAVSLEIVDLDPDVRSFISVQKCTSSSKVFVL